MISMHERRGKASPARREKCRRRTEFVRRLSSGGAWGPEVVESGSSSRRRCFMILSNDHRCTGESETNRGMVATCVYYIIIGIYYIILISYNIYIYIIVDYRL